MPNEAGPTVLGGWRLVGATAVAVVVLIEALLAAHGRGEDGWRSVTRATAATSLGLFLLAYLASPLRRLRSGEVTRWWLRNRRYLGVSFAVSHFAHLGAIVALSRASGTAPPPAVAVAGGLGYVLIAAMVATSFDRSAAWLGARAWNRLHRAGLHYVFGVFLFTYAGAAAQGRVFPALASAALLGAAGLRWLARSRARAGPATRRSS
jgi:DMSO/TMAO reductase YedYZ heme-binding membrane subunit